MRRFPSETPSAIGLSHSSPVQLQLGCAEGHNIQWGNYGQRVRQDWFARRYAEKEGWGDRNPNISLAKRMCTARCTRDGAEYVRNNAATMKVYAVDDHKTRAVRQPKG